MAIIDKHGLCRGDRLRACSDRAKLYWSLLYVGSNGYGRIELSYSAIRSEIFPNFQNPPTDSELWEIFEEYAANFLVILYEVDGRWWAQFATPKKCLPRYKTARDEQSPGPPPAALDAFRDGYLNWKRAKSSINESFYKPSSNFGNVPRVSAGSLNFGNVPQPSSTFGTVPSGIGIGIGLGVVDGEGEARRVAPAPIETNPPEATAKAQNQKAPKRAKATKEPRPMLVQPEKRVEASLTRPDKVRGRDDAGASCSPQTDGNAQHDDGNLVAMPTPKPTHLENPCADDDDPPEGLHPVAYASGLLERIGIPAGHALIQIVASAIRITAKRTATTEAAATKLLELRARLGKEAGERIDRFFWEDARYENPLPGPDPRALLGVNPEPPKAAEPADTVPAIAVRQLERAVSAWDAIRTALKESSNPKSFETWIAPVRAAGCYAGTLYCWTPCQVHKVALNARRDQMQDFLPAGFDKVEFLSQGGEV